MKHCKYVSSVNLVSVYKNTKRGTMSGHSPETWSVSTKWVPKTKDGYESWNSHAAWKSVLMFPFFLSLLQDQSGPHCGLRGRRRQPHHTPLYVPRERQEPGGQRQLCPGSLQNTRPGLDHQRSVHRPDPIVRVPAQPNLGLTCKTTGI